MDIIEEDADIFSDSDTTANYFTYFPQSIKPLKQGKGDF